MAVDPSRVERLAKQGADFRQALIVAMAKKYGERASNAAPISHEREVELYTMPTSPAAQEAIRMGGTPEDAQEANRLWAVGMRQQQQQMREQLLAAGTPTEEADRQIHAAGLSDDAIFQACRKHAYELGKQAGRSDPEQEIKYHEKMTARIATRRAGRQGYADVTAGVGREGS